MRQMSLSPFLHHVVSAHSRGVRHEAHDADCGWVDTAVYQTVHNTLTGGVTMATTRILDSDHALLQELSAATGKQHQEIIHEALEALQGSDGAEGGYDAVVGVAEIGEDEKLEIIELAHAQKKPDR